MCYLHELLCGIKTGQCTAESTPQVVREPQCKYSLTHAHTHRERGRRHACLGCLDYQVNNKYGIKAASKAPLKHAPKIMQCFGRRLCHSN